MEHLYLLSHLPLREGFLDQLRPLLARQEPPSEGELTSSVLKALKSPSKTNPAPSHSYSDLEKSTEDYIETLYRQRDLTLRTLKNTPSIKCVHFWDAHYPARLKFLKYPPWNLFYRGSLPSEDCPTLGVVGTRKPNNYGREIIEAILKPLPPKQFQLVSGLAIGIDSIAHSMSCQEGVKNFGVLANGVAEIYPRTNYGLARDILDGGGGILSELPPQTPPFKGNFFWRNRIISGLSNTVWLVQGTRNSGSRHAAEHAGEQGRLICATPGDIFSELSAIPNEYLNKGATWIFDSKDLEVALAMGFVADRERIV